MKRTMTGLIVITVFVVAVVLADLWFMSQYAAGMNERLDAVANAEGFENQKHAAEELDRYFNEQDFWAHRFIPTGRMEELETLLHKLNAYIATEDEHEVLATAAEIRARVNLLYSTDLYHWYHPADFRIE